MKKSSLIALLAGILAGPVMAQTASPVSALMPRTGDWTSMWWAEGFPGLVDGAPWQRCIQTGSYAMVLDTESMDIPHFGPVAPGTSYATCDRGDTRAWKTLPPAELSLTITADGKTYRCTEGGKWSRHAGPRLIESGRFLQRADLTDLVFRSDDGKRLHVEARFETAAWTDRLGLILAARPGKLPIPAGDGCFGKVGGGFGLDGTNHFEIPHSPELDPEKFTIELWTFLPVDYRATKHSPWLLCKNRNEAHPGNIGILIRNGKPEARMNIGGGKEGQCTITSERALKLDAWNHLAVSYDGDTFRLHLNGTGAGNLHIGRKRSPGRDGLAFGRRQDNNGSGYHFRGVIDEIRIHDRALDRAEVGRSFNQPGKPVGKPVRTWSFRADGRASARKPSARWKSAAMELRLKTALGELHQAWQLPAGQTWTAPDWHDVHLALDPTTTKALAPTSPVVVKAIELPRNAERPVEFSPSRGWHRINLDRVTPVSPPAKFDRKNDSMERIQLVLTNPDAREHTARLMFEKSHGGFSVTGMSAILRGPDGEPTGIPVQLSKNWHNGAQAGVYAGAWFHGISQVRLPANSTTELELSIVYGHWGGVAAASHAQLCLIGWGSNQRWDESALGSWGESICYEPTTAQAQASILDVRPVMVGHKDGKPSWSWTSNVGGGDWFRLFDKSGKRIPPAAMRATYHRYGPCLTEVTYSGRIGNGITHAATASLARTDDIVRGIYRLRLDVKQATDIPRFAIFQVGADTYNFTREGKLALGSCHASSSRPGYATAHFGKWHLSNNIYASVLSHADDRIGQVLDTLDRLQLTDNTLVIFSSDNGPARASGAAKPELTHATGAGYGIGAAKGVTGGRKGHKAALFEGGIGVPRDRKQCQLPLGWLGPEQLGAAPFILHADLLRLPLRRHEHRLVPHRTPRGGNAGGHFELPPHQRKTVAGAGSRQCTARRLQRNGGSEDAL